MIVDVECTANEKNLLIEDEKSGHRGVTRIVARSVVPVLVFVLVGLTAVYSRVSVFFGRAVGGANLFPRSTEMVRKLPADCCACRG